MSLFGNIKELFSPIEDDDDIDYYDEDDDDEPGQTPYRDRGAGARGLPPGMEAGLPRREPIRPPLSRERERENVTPLFRGSELIKRITEKFQIVVIEPKAFDECPQLVDSLKNKKPVIINLEFIDPDTARKIFDFMCGATYALSGDTQKIAQNIFVFLPENVDVQTSADRADFKYGD